MKITIIKQNPGGEETWRYSGTVLRKAEHYLVVEAYFDREDMDFFGLSLRKGDRFVETYYFDRWYNVFEIYDCLDNRLKGWYCNVSSPAIPKGDLLIYRDLELDLLVFPTGKQVVLDEEEFVAQEILPREREFALAALAELQVYFREKFETAK